MRPLPDQQKPEQGTSTLTVWLTNGLGRTRTAPVISEAMAMESSSEETSAGLVRLPPRRLAKAQPGAYYPGQRRRPTALKTMAPIAPVGHQARTEGERDDGDGGRHDGKDGMERRTGQRADLGGEGRRADLIPGGTEKIQGEKSLAGGRGGGRACAIPTRCRGSPEADPVYGACPRRWKRSGLGPVQPHPAPRSGARRTAEQGEQRRRNPETPEDGSGPNYQGQGRAYVTSSKTHTSKHDKWTVVIRNKNKKWGKGGKGSPQTPVSLGPRRVRVRYGSGEGPEEVKMVTVVNIAAEMTASSADAHSKARAVGEDTRRTSSTL
ncbi:hypothetical protein KM043_017535 [Ampulex compressa]|nr:hypothetical protein KM043_017535 [Ampulex compressa]